MLITWKDRHESLLEWLKIYDIPIKMIIIFIILIGVFNIAASLYMIVIEKNSDYAILKAQGLSSKKIQIIIIKEGLIIGFLGGLLGIIISLIILSIQMKFNVISLPKDIYFMEHLPVNAKLSYFFMYPLFAIIITMFCSYAPSIMAKKISPSKVLKYE
jgi:lipoprotein-releasing system permease protein